MGLDNELKMALHYLSSKWVILILLKVWLFIVWLDILKLFEIWEGKKADRLDGVLFLWLKFEI